MSELPDLSAQKPYALDQLAQLQGKIIQLSKSMVLQRARIERCRQSDLAAARDIYAELSRTRETLVETLAQVQLFLMEMEEYALAKVSGQLRQGLAGFALMSTGYIGRILNAYFPEDKPAEIFLTAVQYGMPHRESVRRLLYDSDFNHGSLRFRSWDNSIFSQGTFAGYDIRESAFCFAISGNRQIRCRSPPAALMAIKNL